jgi:hypothetical protein
MGAFVVALFGFGSTAVAQAPFEEGDVCLASFPINPINCTAQDFGVEQLRLVNLIEGCTQEPIGEFVAEMEIVIGSAGANRYDPSFFISLDGTSALTGTNCLHGYLFPPITEAPSYDPDPDPDNPNSVGGDTIYFGDWWNGEPKVPADTCGDMERNTFAVIALAPLRLPCVDNDGDGFVDVSTCAGYENNQQRLCTSVSEAYADVPSKCRCSLFNYPFQPTAIELASFSAVAQGSDVLLAWETATELDNLGFNLYRADSPDGKRSQINGRLIPSEMSGNAMGATYTYLDETAAPGQTYYYWLEDVDVHGLVGKHGPAEATTEAQKTLPGRPRPLPIPAFLSVVASLVIWAVTRL